MGHDLIPMPTQKFAVQHFTRLSARLDIKDV